MPDSIDPTEYEPRYASLQDVPLEVEDTYTEGEKREALFQAEGDYELDYNGGYEVHLDEVGPNHIKAVLNAATYYLVRSATSPKDVTLGELEDGGDQKEVHADQYLETYKSLIERIAEAGGEGEPGTYWGKSGHGRGPVTVNNRDDHRSARRSRRAREGRRYRKRQFRRSRR